MKFIRIALAVYFISGIHQLIAGPVPASFIQELIDRAAPGDEVLIPAGEYQGSIRVGDDVIVRGQGDLDTVLDGQGGLEAVSLGKNSAIIGFNIRNANILVNNHGNFAGIFECSLTGYRQHAIMFAGGSGVAAHNIIEGNGTSTGVLVANANSLIINNRISLNQTGIQILPNLIPTVSDNLFVSNTVAIAATGDAARAVVKRNIFSGNGETIRGFDADPDNAFEGMGADAFSIKRGANTQSYRDLMSETFSAAVADHPIIIYDLQTEAGAFDAIGLFPWATFTLSASANDTRIETYRAFDIVTDRSLNAEYVEENARPSVRVMNPGLTEKMRERYVLENRYIHPASYFDESSERRVFKRLTNVAQIEIVIPAGYEAVSCRPSGRIAEGADQRRVMVITSMGDTQIELVLQKSR